MTIIDDNIAEKLYNTLKMMVDDTRRWNEAVTKIIGRCPQNGIALEQADKILAEYEARK